MNGGERATTFAARGPQGGHALFQKVEREKEESGQMERGKEESGQKESWKGKVGKEGKGKGSNTPMGQRPGEF